MSAITLKKYTFMLPPDLVEKLRRHAEDLGMPSLDDVVRAALEAYVKKLDRLAYRAAMQKAAADPEFRRDVEETMRDFGRIDWCKMIFHKQNQRMPKYSAETISIYRSQISAYG